MKTLQLFKEGKQIIATDGIMHVDGRLNPANIKRAVIDRNKRFAKNFPHKIADSFAVYRDRIGGSLGPVIFIGPEVSVYTLPVYWAGALINGDYSGLHSGEIVDIENWLKTADCGGAVSMSEDTNFQKFMGLGCEVAEYTFLK